MSLVQDIEKVLPQTQCQACGYAGCRPYAQALASGKASIDRCPPGGKTTLEALAKLLKQDAKPYLAAIEASYRPPTLAQIDEERCIGCTKCIQVCPVDAIVGAPKYLHHIVEQDCTGCGLCVEPCPVDCIEMLPIAVAGFDPERARLRFEQRLQRLDNLARQKAKNSLDSTSNEDKQNYILAALARVKQKK
jgi:electron transport complex protein RnfB